MFFAFLSLSIFIFYVYRVIYTIFMFYYLLFLESNWIAENNLIFNSKFEYEPTDITINKTTL